MQRKVSIPPPIPDCPFNYLLSQSRMCTPTLPLLPACISKHRGQGRSCGWKASEKTSRAWRMGAGGAEWETEHPENCSWIHRTDSEGMHPFPGLGYATAWGGGLTNGSKRSCGPCAVPGQCKRDAYSRAEELSSPFSHMALFGFAQDSDLMHKNTRILPEGFLIDFPAG